MKWLVKKGDEYLTGRGEWVDKRENGWTFDSRDRARHFAYQFNGRVVKLVPKRKPMPLPELAKALGVKYEPSGRMTLNVVLTDPEDLKHMSDAAKVLKEHSPDCGDTIIVSACGWKVGHVTDWSFSWS